MKVHDVKEEEVDNGIGNEVLTLTDDEGIQRFTVPEDEVCWCSLYIV